MWIIRRKQKDLFEIALFPSSIQIIESYTLLKLTQDEYDELVSKALWENVDGILRVIHITVSPYNILYR